MMILAKIQKIAQDFYLIFGKFFALIINPYKNYMKKTTLLLVIFSALLLNIHFVNAQNTKPITFQGFTVEMPNNIKDFSLNQLPARTSQDIGHYVILQFDNTPTQNVQNNFGNIGIELNNYISNNSYFTIIPENISPSFLESSGVISVLGVPTDFKISSRIKNGEIGMWAQEGNNILVHLVYHQEFGYQKFVSEINTISGVSVQQEYGGSNIVALSIPSDQINSVANLSSVKWLELIPEPSVKDDDGGRSIHRASNLDTQTMSGRNYTGEGIGVMVRDDGIVGPHIDFEGRIDNSFATGTGQTHGDGVAGIMAGAGNLDPTKRGMAAGSNVYIVNYNSTHLDSPTTTLINNDDVQITNSSYSDGCNVGYTTNSSTVDTQMNTNSDLLHVFSAGNSNNNNCGYGAGSQWGNITGGHKQGKNVIATANVFANGALVNSSSRGPAYDGRIKPDITAHGQGQLSTNENNGYLTFGGTSGAAPGIAGVSAQLYQLYREENGGDMPDASLIKATLLNTANDYGNVGPDFRFGWGVVNGLRAAMLLEDGRYLDDEVTQGADNNHVINVPANTVQVRFMVYWNDPAAVAGSSSALVNDLDLVVTDPSASDYQPWVLDHTPNATTLNLPAANGVDRLNNMEQVLINNPAAGDYTINVTGFNVPVGPQKYFVVYEIITEELTLTYPNGNEKLVPGEQTFIHWDAVGTTDGFDLEYSTDNGTTWNNITTAASTATNFVWTVPNDISGEGLIRITSGSFTDDSDDVFSIADVVSGVQITQVCPTELTVTWDALTDATSYDVYLLGEKFMEKMGSTSDTTFDVSIANPVGSFWVAVSATGGTNNWESRRSIAVNRQTTGLFNCELADDLSISSINNDLNAISVICTGSNEVNISANLENLGTGSQSNFTISYQLDSEPIVNETYTGTLASGATEAYIFTTPLIINAEGTHTLNVWVDLTGDEYAINDGVEGSFYTQINPTIFNEGVEGFEDAGFLPGGWGTDNSDGLITWEEASVVGPTGTTTSAAWMNNFDYSANGQEDILLTEVYDLGGTSLSLTFDVAKAQRSAAAEDVLRVEVSTDCFVTKTIVYEKTGLDLSTLPGYVGFNWTPVFAGHWRNEVIDLTPFQNQNVQIRFVNVNNSGNSTLIDNVEITGVLSTKDENFNNYFSLFPNPANDRFSIRSTEVSLDEIEVYNLLGKKVQSQKVNNGQELINVNIETLPKGVYVVRLKSELGTFFKKIIKS